MYFVVIRPCISQSVYHYYKGEKHYLSINDQKKYFALKAGTSANQLNRLLTTEGFISHGSGALPNSSIHWAIIENKSRAKIPAENLLYESPFFTNEFGASTGLSQFFYVKLKNPAMSERFGNSQLDTE